MPVITVALHLTQLLLRLLRLVLPFPPFAPVPSSRPSLGPPRASRRALARRNHPALCPASLGTNASLAPAKSLNVSPALQSAAGRLSPAPDTPQTPPKHTPRRLKSFLEKTLTAREALAQDPANTPSVPAPSPGPSAGHMPHAQGTCQPIPVAPMGRPAVSLPPLGAVVPGVRSPKSRSKNPPKPSLASPSPLGTGWRETVPPSPPRLCGPRPPRRPCTLLPRSTVTPESRS